MYEYLDIHKEQQDEKNTFFPTVQLQLKKRRISCIENARFMNELIKDYYEKPELFEDENFKIRIKLTEMAKRTSERINKLSYRYESFKKKKFLKIETEEGKIARASNLESAYVTLTKLGEQEFLNLDKKDLESELIPFGEQYLDKYSFVLEENRKYIKEDSEKIRIVLKELFKQIKPKLMIMYKNHYNGYKKIAYRYVELEGDKLIEFDKSIRRAELAYFLTKVTDYDYLKRTHSLKYNEEEFNKYIDGICTKRVKEDEEEFVYKLALKIASIIKGRTYKIEASINLDLESILEIVLSDDSKFKVKTQIVKVTNQYGTMFIRKPTTFHNVYFANGEGVKTPSYEKLVRNL